MLYLAFLSFSQSDLHFLLALTRTFAASLARSGRFFFANAFLFTADRARLLFFSFAFAGRHAAVIADLKYRFAVPFGIEKVVICVNEIVDREVILAVKEPRPAPI